MFSVVFASLLFLGILICSEAVSILSFRAACFFYTAAPHPQLGLIAFQTPDADNAARRGNDSF